LVAVEGRLQIRSYDDNQGVRRKAAEVIADNVRFLDRAKDSPSAVNSHLQEGALGEEISYNEKDIPF